MKLTFPQKVDGCDDILQIPPNREAAGELEQRHLQVAMCELLFQHIKHGWTRIELAFADLAIFTHRVLSIVN